MVQIEVTSRQKIKKIDSRIVRRLVRWVLSQLEIPHAHVEIAFVDNSTIHQVNKTHLRHDWPTDVITFPHPEIANSWGGEIVVSVEYAKDQAPRYGHTIESEVYLYIVHGMLHLAGYDDHSSAERKRMHARQRNLLKRFLAESELVDGPADTVSPR